VGERIWGFLPMASHVVMSPGKLRGREFTDQAAHRQALPGIYNNYQRTNNDPAELKALEDLRCLLFPLFMTSYIIYDFLVDNDFFGAEQVLVGSASSKTGLGLLDLLARHPGRRPRVIGLTSPANTGFVRALGTCDQVVIYDEISGMDCSVPSAFVDMSGHGPVIAAVHEKFGEHLKVSTAVGATHWDTGRFRPQAGGRSHDFFFAPSQFAKREQDWGPGEVFRRAQIECIRMAQKMKQVLDVRTLRGPESVAEAFQGLVAGRTPPDIALIGSLHQA